ncbi:MAG: hypothetical protein ACRC78_05630 [Planktothrix sp.]
MSGKSLIVLGLIGGLVYYFTTNLIAKISYGVATMRIHKVTFQSIEVRITLPVINENDTSATVEGFLGQLFFQKTAIGLINLITPTVVKGFQVTDLEFRCNINISSVGIELFNIIKSGSWNAVVLQDFRVKGTLRGANLSIPIDTPLA